MSNATTIDRDDDINFIMEDIVKTRKSHQRKVGNAKVAVRSTVEIALDDYKEAKDLHEAEIKKLKAEDKLRHLIIKNDIKAHRNLIKSAQTSYIAVKLAEKKKEADRV